MYVNNTKITWSEAEDYCLTKYNTHLASIHSEDDLLISSLFSKNNLLWYGLSQKDRSSELRFSDDSEINGNIIDNLLLLSNEPQYAISDLTSIIAGDSCSNME